MKILKIMLATFFGFGTIAFLGTFIFMRKAVGYSVETDGVYYKSINNMTWKKEAVKIAEADSETFKVFGFNGIYGKDKNHVYLYGIIIKGADPASFKILGDLYKYARDKNNLYAGIKKIGDDPDSFKLLAEGFAKDNKQAYYRGNIIERADGKTFELMDEKGQYAKDKNHVFCFGKLIEGSHSPTFDLMEYNYYVDKNHVYHRSQKLEEVDKASFKLLGNRYAKDVTMFFMKRK